MKLVHEIPSFFAGVLPLFLLFFFFFLLCHHFFIFSGCSFKMSKRKRNDVAEDMKSCESESDDEERVVRQDAQALEKLQEEASNDEHAGCSIADVLQNAKNWEEAMEEVETHIRQCQEWFETQKAVKEAAVWDACVKRRRKRIKQKNPLRLKEFVREDNAPWIPSDRSAATEKKFQYPEASGVVTEFTRSGSQNVQYIMKHPLECRRYKIGKQVGLVSMMQGVYAEGEIVDALPCIGLYRVKVLRSWGRHTVPLGERVCQANELVGALESKTGK